MKKAIILLITIAASMSGAMAQTAGQWRSYLSYYSTNLVAEGDEYVFAVANGSLYSYRKDDSSLRYYSKENGMTDNQITAIAYNSSEKTFVIAYSSGNIDLVTESHTIYNIPYLMSSTGIQDKTINSIYMSDEYAYLSANFGILVLNVKKKEIKETCILDAPVSSVAISGTSIYATTAKGALTASLSDNLINPQNWQTFTHGIADATAADSIRQICNFQDGITLLVKNKGLYYYKKGESTRRILAHNSIRNIKHGNARLAAFSPTELYIFTTPTDYDKGAISNISDASIRTDNIWLAIGESGLIAISRQAPSQYRTITEIPNAGSPKYNYNDFLTLHNSKLFIAGGGRWSNRYRRPATVMSYDLDSLTWHNLPNIKAANDATCIAIDPADNAHLFISTWGEGIFEYQGDEQVAHYDHTNSALASIYPTSSTAANYVRTEGITFDKDKNLWMTNSEVASIIVLRKADGTWKSLNYPDISNATLADKILIASNGLKWINLVRDKQSGIFVLDDKNTPDDTADDESHYYSSLYDTQGDIGAKEFTSIAEDLTGTIWIGTNRGPVYIPVPSRGPTGTMLCQRIIYTDRYGLLDYFLKDERINAIAVDGGNRKWIATESSGLYLISEDGLEVINHFTSTNSPLLSDRILSLAINNRTGELFIGTDKGLISYIGDAISGAANYSAIYAYPNPVRPEYGGSVIITGLMANSTVKITDARGTLITTGRSNGGQFSWNLRNAAGKPATPGVYLVLASTPEATESVVTRIAVVR
jgi:hypothetical protein